MSRHRQTHSNSSLSDTNSSGSAASRSSSSEHSSYPTVQSRHNHHHHTASGPPGFASHMHSHALTSKAFSPSSSTLVSSDDEKVASNPSPATKITATPSAETKKKAKSRSSASKHEKSKGERGCLDFDWSYRNVHSSGSSHGRKAISGGGGPVGACVLM